jgi:transcriptional regulator with AAA-type ATPase domain
LPSGFRRSKNAARDKIALKSFLSEVIGQAKLDMLPELPNWLADAVADIHYPGNVREWRNFTEGVGVRRVMSARGTSRA